MQTEVGSDDDENSDVQRKRPETTPLSLGLSANYSTLSIPTSSASRRDAYTCWPSNTGTKQFNYGTRIDHILCAGPCLHQEQDLQGHNLFTCHVKECDILIEYKRWKPGNTPSYRWKGGMNVKLESSDHAPVYTSLVEVPEIPQHSTPSLASRYLPMIHDLQQTLVSVLMKREFAKQVESCEISDSFSVPTTSTKNCSESFERSLNSCCDSASPRMIIFLSQTKSLKEDL